MQLTTEQLQYIELRLKNATTRDITAVIGEVAFKEASTNRNVLSELAGKRLKRDADIARDKVQLEAEKELIRQLRHKNNLKAATATANCLEFLSQCMGDPDIEMSEKIKIALRMVAPAVKHAETLASLSAEKSFADDQASARTKLPEVE